MFAAMLLANDAERKRLLSRANHLVAKTLSMNLYHKFRLIGLTVSHPFRRLFVKFVLFLIISSIAVTCTIGLAVKVPELFAKSLAEQYEMAMVKKESASSLDDKMAANKLITAYNQSWEKYPEKRGSFRQIDRVAIDKADYVKAEHDKLVSLCELAEAEKSLKPNTYYGWEKEIKAANKIILDYNTALGKSSQEVRGDLKKVEYVTVK